MRIPNLVTNVVVGLAVGAGDSALEEQDVKKNRAGLKAWSNWLRIGATALGYIGQATGRYSNYATPLAQSGVTLLGKSAYDMIRTGKVMGGTTTVKPQVTGRVRQTTYPDFTNLKIS